MANKEIATVLRHARRQGWRIENTGRSHFKLVGPDWQPVFCAATPSGGNRALANLHSMLRKHGLEI